MKKICSAFAVVSMFSALTACSMHGSDDPGAANDSPATPTQAPSDDPMTNVTPPDGMAIVRVVHASSDAPAVDVYAKGSDTPLVTGLAYGDTSGWLTVPPGTYQLELRAAPSKPTDPLAYTTPALAIPAGTKITAVAAGLLSSQDADSAFRILPVVEGFGQSEGGKARIRILHAGSDAPSVGIDVGNDDPTKPEVTGLQRFADTGAEGVSLPANEALAVGIDLDGARVTAFTTPKLPDSANVLVIATGLLGKLGRERDGFALLAVGPNGNLGFIKQDPIVYALHASPDAPAVDAFVGNAEIIDNISFGGLSGMIQVQPGQYQVDFFAHTDGGAKPTSAPAATVSTGALAAGERYLSVATGFLAGGTNPFRLDGYRDGFALGTGQAQLRAVHNSPDATEVDIGLATATNISPILFPALSFSQSSAEEGLGAAPGQLPIGITPAGYDSTFVAKFMVPLAADNRAFVLASGALETAKGASFRLLVVDTANVPWTVTAVHPH